jgi:glycosyltransferase involved in cell wall biosynthesis
VSGRIFQLVADFQPEDAIGNHARTMARLLGERSGGFIVDRAAAELRDLTVSWRRAAPASGDVVVYHVAGAARPGLAEWFASLPARKVIDYHNITPSEFFRAYDPGISAIMAAGRRELASLAPRTALAIAHSELSRGELEAMGFARTLNLPVLVDFARLEAPGNEALLAELRTGKRERGDVLFVSRVAPNKRQEDVIKAFTLYRRVFRPTARLFLVGGADPPSYLRALEAFVARLGIEGVHLVGKIPLADLISHYRNADLFLSMSEHEGFGIPWLEAMHFGVPVLAFAAGAIAETVGDAAVLFRAKRYDEVGALMHVLCTDEPARASLAEAGRRRVAELAPERVGPRLRSALEALTALTAVPSLPEGADLP